MKHLKLITKPFALVVLSLVAMVVAAVALATAGSGFKERTVVARGTLGRRTGVGVAAPPRRARELLTQFRAQVDRLLRVTRTCWPLRRRCQVSQTPLWVGGQPPEDLPAATVVEAAATPYVRPAEDPTRGVSR